MLTLFDLLSTKPGIGFMPSKIHLALVSTICGLLLFGTACSDDSESSSGSTDDGTEAAGQDGGDSGSDGLPEVGECFETPELYWDQLENEIRLGADDERTVESYISMLSAQDTFLTAVHVVGPDFDEKGVLIGTGQGEVRSFGEGGDAISNWITIQEEPLGRLDTDLLADEVDQVIACLPS